MNLIVNNLHISYSREGSGPAMLMLHGWGSDKQTFALIESKLKSEYEVITLDLPGFGGSQKPPEAWGIEEYVQFVADFLGKIKAEPDVIVGHSMGGRISLQGLGRSKLKTKKLVLLASHGINESQSIRNQSFKAAAKSGKVATMLLPPSVRRRLRKKLYKTAGASDYLEAGDMQDSFKKIIATDAREDAKNVSVPTLLVYGANDDQTPPSFGEEFKSLINDSTLVVVEGAGHFVHLDKPTEVLGYMEEFLS